MATHPYNNYLIYYLFLIINLSMVFKDKLTVIKKEPTFPKNFLKRMYLYLILLGDFIEKKLLYNSVTD